MDQMACTGNRRLQNQSGQLPISVEHLYLEPLKLAVQIHVRSANQIAGAPVDGRQLEAAHQRNGQSFVGLTTQQVGGGGDLVGQPDVGVLQLAPKQIGAASQ